MSNIVFLKNIFLKPSEIQDETQKIIKFAIIITFITILLYILFDFFLNRFLLVDLQYGYFREFGVLFKLLIEDPTIKLIERFIIALGFWLFLKLFSRKKTYSLYSIIFIVFLYSIIDLIFLPFYLVVIISNISYDTYEIISLLIGVIVLLLVIIYPAQTFNISWPKKLCLLIFTLCFTFGFIAGIDYILTA